jgi:hypothetical protein
MMNLKCLEKIEKANPQINRWKKIIKIGGKFMKCRQKEQYNNSMNQRVGSLKR